MLTVALVIVVAVTSSGLGQTPDAQSSAPKTQKTCIIILKSGEEFPVFLDTNRKQDFESSQGVYRLTLDTPWAPGEKYFADAQIKEFVPERLDQRQKRLQEGWDKQGYVLFEGRPIPKREMELAQRARQMAGIEDGNKRALPPPTENALPEPAPLDSSIEPRPSGIFARWGLHAAIVIMSALLLAVVARKMIFARP